MSKHFSEVVEKQRATPINDYDNVLNRIYSRYDTDTLVKEVEIYLL